MPEFVYGAYAFTFSGAYSGYGPTKIQGPDRTMHVVEHQIPAREGGIIEYLGSQQSTYQFKGFIVQQEGGNTAALVLSGTSWLAINADDAKDFLRAMRGSGSQLLKIESTYSHSGVQVLYENGFFQIEKITLAFEGGRGYPYYPYSIDFRGTSPATHGNSSGTATFSGQVGGGYSGYVFAWTIMSGVTTSGGITKGEVINTLGVFLNTATSGTMKVAIYSGTLASNQNGLVAGSAPQTVHSGWNYFPLRPSFVSVSGYAYIFAFAGDSANASGYTVAMSDTTVGGTSGLSAVVSGVTYSSFPLSSFTALSGGATSGMLTDIVMVAAV